jgi:hypothetical protein
MFPAGEADVGDLHVQSGAPQKIGTDGDGGRRVAVLREVLGHKLDTAFDMADRVFAAGAGFIVPGLNIAGVMHEGGN